MRKQRISYVDPNEVSDERMKKEFERCRDRGTPRPESQAIRAHGKLYFMRVFVIIQLKNYAEFTYLIL